MQTHNYQIFASSYADLGFSGTYYLLFRDLPTILQASNDPLVALDYGCGAGRSTRFLKSLGYIVIGVDHNKAMLREARQRDPEGTYLLIESGVLPIRTDSFDVIFSSFVLLEVPTLAEIQKIMIELVRVLRPTGKIIIVTATGEQLQGDWVSFSTDFPENERSLTSGDTVKLLIRPDIILHDYYWTDEDYLSVFQAAGLSQISVHRPIGRESDPVQWRDEIANPPYTIYVLAKNPK